MKILSAKQIHSLDAYTIAQDAITSIDLMERACRAFVSWYVERFNSRLTIGIVCGPGNNGGDGLGIARLLSERGHNVTVWLVNKESGTTDFVTNLSRIRTSRIPIFEILQEDQTLQPFDSCEVVIDALFGSGMNRAVEGLNKWIIECINRADATRVAVDIPSGLMADEFSSGAIVQAHYTLSFQLPKLSFLLPKNSPYVGEWCLVDIGLRRDFIKQADSKYFYTTAKDARRLLRTRSKFDHKGTYGHALLIAGSLGKLGACVLSSRAALRAGLGLLTVHLPKCGNGVLQSSVPEAMLSLDRNEEMLTTPPSLESYGTVGIGPGLGTGIDTVNAVRFVLENFKKPMVIDADALNIISENKELMHLIPAGSILTPHPKEFERLVGRKWENDFVRLDMQRDLAMKLKAVIVVKGAFTTVAAPDGVLYFNSTGNPGMATGGTGDVLTGILTGLLAQHYEPVQAAILGVYLHGLAGDLAVPEVGMNSLIASDVIDFLPKSFLHLKKD